MRTTILYIRSIFRMPENFQARDEALLNQIAPPYVTVHFDYAPFLERLAWITGFDHDLMRLWNY